MTISTDKRVVKLKTQINKTSKLLLAMYDEPRVRWKEVNTVQALLSTLQFELDKTREAQINQLALDGKKALTANLKKTMRDFVSLEKELTKIGDRLELATKLIGTLRNLLKLYGYAV
tara:strand:- start:159 stop:509 length:351 start_codon:yes stop_codon:yes gene_type:complete